MSIQDTAIAGTLCAPTGAVRQVSGDTREWRGDFEDSFIEWAFGAPLVIGWVTMYIGADHLRVQFRNEKVVVAWMVEDQKQGTKVEVRCAQLLRALTDGMYRPR